MLVIIICIGCSVITSALITKILVTHYFKIVDGYVDEMCEKTREFVDDCICK